MAGGHQSIARHRMLVEAIQIIRALFDGGYVSFWGDFFEVDSAKLWDLGEQAPAIGIAASGAESCRIAGQYGDALIAVAPERRLGQLFGRHGGAGEAPDRTDPSVLRHEQIPGGRPRPRSFPLVQWRLEGQCRAPQHLRLDSASQHVRLDDVAASIPCGDDVGEFVQAIGAFPDAGFSDVALVQIGGDAQRSFIEWCGTELLPSLRSEG